MIQLKNHMSEISKDRCEEAFYNYLVKFSKKFKNKKILDIGCGNGDHTEIFSNISKNTYGLDIVDIRLDQYRNKFKFIKGINPIPIGMKVPI